MKLQPNHVEKPLRKLRKQLKKLPASPPPEDVHSLRTQTRRLEATVAALALGKAKKWRRLLKLLTPVRKAAGKVRDMDVLVSDIMKLSGEGVSEPAVRLVEHMAKMRVGHARKLHKLVSGRRKKVRRDLKVSAQRLRKTVKTSTGPEGETPAQILLTELRNWPELHEGNLHLFRIRVKELRYMLQLGEPAHSGFLDALGEVKDTIGEWHDWVELQKIAAKVLEPGPDTELLATIARIAEEKLIRSLAVANRLRSEYFAVHDPVGESRKVLRIAS